MKTHLARTSMMIALLSLAVSACGAHEAESKSGLDVHISEEASAADAGLPAYPGARPYREAGDSSSSANIGLATPLFGLKVAAMELETADRPEQVAAFYREALSKYGNVLDCSEAGGGKEKSQPGTGLTCDPGDPGEYSVVYKVGTEENQRIVAVGPHGSGTRFSLVHVDVRDESKH